MLISWEITWKVMHLDCVNSLQGDEWRVFSILTARGSLMRERSRRCRSKSTWWNGTKCLRWLRRILIFYSTKFREHFTNNHVFWPRVNSFSLKVALNFAVMLTAQSSFLKSLFQISSACFHQRLFRCRQFVPSRLIQPNQGFIYLCCKGLYTAGGRFRSWL